MSGRDIIIGGKTFYTIGQFVAVFQSDEKDSAQSSFAGFHNMPPGGLIYSALWDDYTMDD
jgi:hypothetical protein